jgi:TATA-box binding protein (TBP) (component of TFIID and TFIIIB)
LIEERQLKMGYRVVNMVFTGKICDQLDLKYITSCYSDTKYNPSRFNGLSMRLNKGTVLLFKTGRFVLVGQHSTKGARSSLDEIEKDLKTIGFETDVKTFKCVNIVGAHQMSHGINLEAIVRSDPIYASLEPELFPGLKLRFFNRKYVATVFPGGKYYIAGARQKKALDKAMKSLYSKLSLFAK